MNTNCLVNCPEIYYSSFGICLKCVNPCLTCKTELLCLSCITGYLANFKCAIACP